MSPDDSLATFDEKMKEPPPGGFASLPLKARLGWTRYGRAWHGPAGRGKAWLGTSSKGE
jgi:hypothetical protein